MIDKDQKKERKASSTYTLHQRQRESAKSLAECRSEDTANAGATEFSCDSVIPSPEMDLVTRQQAVHKAAIADLIHAGRDHPDLIAAYVSGVASAEKMAGLIGADEATINAALGPADVVSFDEVLQVLQQLTEEGEIDEATVCNVLALLEESGAGQERAPIFSLPELRKRMVAAAALADEAIKTCHDTSQVPFASKSLPRG